MAEDPHDERVSWSRPAALPGTEVLLVERSLQARSQFHENYVVCVGTRIATEWRYRGKMHSAGDGTLLFMEPGETHVNTAVHKPQDFKVLFMSPALVETAAGELGLPAPPHLGVAQLRRRDVFRSFDRFLAAVEHGEGILEQQSRFAACLGSIFDSCLERGAAPVTLNDHPAVERAKRHLRDRWSEPVSLDELATTARISRFHLVRMFTAQVGVPPHAYQILLRVERARSLFNRGLPAAEVAASVGFADQSHLIRHFKRVYGLPPGHYLRASGRPAPREVPLHH